MINKTTYLADLKYIKSCLETITLSVRMKVILQVFIFITSCNSGGEGKNTCPSTVFTSTLTTITT